LRVTDGAGDVRGFVGTGNIEILFFRMPIVNILFMFAGTWVRAMGGWIMLLRVVAATVGKGVKLDHGGGVETHRNDAGKAQDRAVINLGRRDLLAAHLDLTSCAACWHGDAVATDSVKREDLDVLDAWI